MPTPCLSLEQETFDWLRQRTGEHVHRAVGSQTASWISASADGAQASSLVSPVLQKVLIGVLHWKQSPNLAQLAAPVASSANFLLGTRSLPPFFM